MSISGCAMNGPVLTTNQRIARCGATVLGTTLLGALIGGAVDGRRGGGAGRGAVIGAGVGVGICAVWLAFENERDKRRLVQAQLSAAQTGRSVNDTWTGEDGQVRTVVAVPSTQTQMVPRNAPRGQTQPEPQLCRQVTITPSVNGQSADPFTTVVCRDSQGNYTPAQSEMVAI